MMSLSMIPTGDSQDIGHEEKLKNLILQSKIKDDAKVTKEIYKNGETRDSFFEYGRGLKYKRGPEFLDETS